LFNFREGSGAPKGEGAPTRGTFSAGAQTGKVSPLVVVLVSSKPAMG